MIVNEIWRRVKIETRIDRQPRGFPTNERSVIAMPALDLAVRIVEGLPIAAMVIGAQDSLIWAANPPFRAFLASPLRDVALRGYPMSAILPMYDEPEFLALLQHAARHRETVAAHGMHFVWLSDPRLAWDVEISLISGETLGNDLILLTVQPSAQPVQDASMREEQLQEKVEEMELLNDVLIGSVQQKNHFLTAMSHRLRTPLTTIVGFGEMLVAGDVIDPDDQQMVYGDIVSASRQMLALLDDMIELARLDAGNLRLRRTHVAVSDLLIEVGENLNTLAASRRQRVVIEIQSPDLRIFADERWTREILLKLGSNALRFSPTSGAVTLCARDNGDGFAALDVIDTGVGIRAEEQGNIFQPFAHVNDAGGNNAAGGLELALAKRLVELQGGSITFSSTRGVGTTFTVTLPTTGVEVPEAF